MNLRFLLKMTLYSGGLIIVVLLYIIIFRPDVFWSAEDKVLQLSSWKLDDGINEAFVQLQESGTTLNNLEAVRTKQHIFQIVSLYYDANTLCVLHTVETPASNPWRKWFPAQGSESRVGQSRQMAAIELTDDVGTDYSFLGFNSSTDAVQKVAHVSCYSAPPAEAGTLYITLGDSDIAEDYVDFQIALVP
ncbi:hypothetical protein MNBD_CHLOROFLEXI01-3580 [hydrothermal vent metagenome]|uniref:Uncharacterized protein n=1 Tax=hydrothermal vent metagenome TaxID=652676 RepID=A0A3B0USN8_9ZZZZ